MSEQSKPKVWLHGHSGRMGQEISACLAKPEAALQLVGGSGRLADEADAARKLADTIAGSQARLVLDFSTPAGSALLRGAFGEKSLEGLSLVIGTTGLDAQELAAWRRLAATQSLRLLIAPNTSIGILVLSKLTRLATSILTPLGYDLEIVEAHHKHKRDAPSGTARFLAASAQAALPSLRCVDTRTGAREAGEIGMHAIRGGGVFGEHELRFLGPSDELSLGHRAFSRSLFAQGAVLLGGWLLQQEAGVHELADIELESLAKLASP